MTKFEFITGSSSEELRQAYMQRVAIPTAAAIFGRDAGVGAVLIVVAQYWCDEAADAVSVEEVITETRDPRWPDVYAGNPFYEADLEYQEEGADLCYEPTARGEAALGSYPPGERPQYPILDGNTNAIPAFAAYCREPGDQERTLASMGDVYAILRPAPDCTVEVEIVGTQHRPEWEDRFDVGFAVEDEGVTYARLEGDWSGGPNPAGPTGPAAELAAREAQGAPARKPSFFRRLFGLR